MRGLALVVHTSLDGFVAASKGELNGFPTGEENLPIVFKLTKKANAALFGGVSYQLLDSYRPTAAQLPCQHLIPQMHNKYSSKARSF